MSTAQTSSEVYALSKAKNTANGLAIHAKERMYTIDSGAWVHMMGLSSLNSTEKKTIRRSNKILDVQTSKGIVVSDTQAKIYILELALICVHFWWKINHQCCRGKTMQWAWLFLFVAVRRHSQIIKS